MKTERMLAMLLAFCMLLGLAACGAEQAAPAEAGQTVTETVPAESLENVTENEAETLTVTDMIGREVEVVPGSYERVACIGAGALRMYCYVGDVSLLCGVEDIDNLTLSERPKMFDSVARPYVLAYGDTFAALPSCGVGGPQAQSAEAEKILSCAPDIVISEFEDVEKENALQEQLGVPVITLRTGADGVFAEEFAGSLNLLGTIFGREEQAEKLGSFVSGEIAEIGSRTEDVPEEEKPSVYICGLGNWGTTNHLMTAGRFAAFEAAGIRNAAQGVGLEKIGEIEDEMFIALGEKMDVMVIDAAAVKNIAPLYAEDPELFSNCRAWNDGEVYLEMAYNAYYTNYEIALANAWFAAKTAYPERFENVDMAAKLDEITEAFLGKPLSAEIFACPASYGGYQKINTAEFFR